VKAEFLDWLEREMELTKEQQMAVGIESIDMFLREEWGMKPLTPRQREGIQERWVAMTRAGDEGARYEYIPTLEQWRWRDIVTGRFVVPPKGWTYKGRRAR